MTLSTDYLNASPTYARARSLGVRLVPLAVPRPSLWPFVKVAFVGTFGVLLGLALIVWVFA